MVRGAWWCRDSGCVLCSGVPLFAGGPRLRVGRPVAWCGAGGVFPVRVLLAVPMVRVLETMHRAMVPVVTPMVSAGVGLWCSWWCWW